MCITRNIVEQQKLNTYIPKGPDSIWNAIIIYSENSL